MKIRVRLPDASPHSTGMVQNEPDFDVDEILLWGMETGMDIAFYRYYREPGQHWSDRRRWAVFTVESDYTFMFSLKYGALLHRGAKNASNTD